MYSIQFIHLIPRHCKESCHFNAESHRTHATRAFRVLYPSFASYSSNATLLFFISRQTASTYSVLPFLFCIPNAYSISPNTISRYEFSTPYSLIAFWSLASAKSESSMIRLNSSRNSLSSFPSGSNLGS